MISPSGLRGKEGDVRLHGRVQIEFSPLVKECDAGRGEDLGDAPDPIAGERGGGAAKLDVRVAHPLGPHDPAIHRDGDGEAGDGHRLPQRVELPARGRDDLRPPALIRAGKGQLLARDVGRQVAQRRHDAQRQARAPSPPRAHSHRSDAHSPHASAPALHCPLGSPGDGKGGQQARTVSSIDDIIRLSVFEDIAHMSANGYNARPERCDPTP